MRPISYYRNKRVNQETMSEYINVCQKYRELPLHLKLFEMAEAILEADIIVVKEFNAATTVALGTILIKRLNDINNIKFKE